MRQEAPGASDGEGYESVLPVVRQGVDCTLCGADRAGGAVRAQSTFSSTAAGREAGRAIGIWNRRRRVPALRRND